MADRTGGGNTWLSTTETCLDGSSAVREKVKRPGPSTETVTYLTRANGTVYRRSGAGVKTWYAYDGLGSVLGEISVATGNLAKARVYDVYGTVRLEDTATSQSKHRFVGALGHPSEYETGLVYMRARYMDASRGRFVSEDSARDGANWFIYADNDPANEVDGNGDYAAWVDAVVMGGKFFADYLGWDNLQYSEALERARNMLEAAAFLDGVDKYIKWAKKGALIEMRSAATRGDIFGATQSIVDYMKYGRVGDVAKSAGYAIYVQQALFMLMVDNMDEEPIRRK